MDEGNHSQSSKRTGTGRNSKGRKVSHEWKQKCHKNSKELRSDEVVDIASTGVKKNTSLLNMLRMQSLGDNEDLTPTYVKPGKIQSKMTAFDEGMQKQGLVVPAQLEPHVVKNTRKHLTNQSGALKKSETPVSASQKAQIAGPATIVQITTSKFKKRPNTTARTNKRTESKATSRGIESPNTNYRVHKTRTGIDTESAETRGNTALHAKYVDTNTDEKSSQPKTRAKSRINDYVNEPLGKASGGARHMGQKANVFRPNRFGQSRRMEKHGMNPLDDYLVGYKLTQAARPKTQMAARKQSSSSAQTANKQVYGDNISQSKHT